MMVPTKRRFIWQILDSSAKYGVIHRWVDHGLLGLILINVIAVVLESEAAFYQAHAPIFAAIEVFSVIVFSIEYALRLWACVEDRSHNYRHPLWGRTRYALSPLAIFDLLAIAPFYLDLLLPIDLRILRVFRIFRLLKLTRYSPALTSLAAVARAEKRSLIGTFLLLCIIIMLSSALMYQVEHLHQPDKFGTIPQAMWWAVITLTTVGYGDVTPITQLGKLLGGVIALMGLATFALPAAILAAGFANEFRRRDFVLTISQLTQIPLFKGLNPALIAQIAGLLVPRSVAAKYQLMRRGDPADALYVIVEGEIEVAHFTSLPDHDTNPSRHITHGSGEVIGERALLAGGRHRLVDATTKTDCKLLVLYAEGNYSGGWSDCEDRSAVEGSLDRLEG